MDGGKMILTSELLATVIKMDSIEGITISGGEPFAQADALSNFLTEMNEIAPHLTVMVFTGYLLSHLRRLQSLPVERILAHTDILIDGLFREDMPSNAKWTGSANQTVNFLSNRYDEQDMLRSRRSTEIFADEHNGGVFAVGIPFSNS
jgi:anaerobic ribonucleoside-triphosphate reductase activating protein